MTKADASLSKSPLISVSELKQMIGDGTDACLDQQVLIFDCRFQLDKPEWGQAAFLESHLPGAQFLDLDKDLSSQVQPGVTGRHPLPQPQALASTLRDKGVNGSSIVVVYDDGPGFFAARAWWLLRWLGHDKVVVLDGGFKAWLAAGGAIAHGEADRLPPGNFQASVEQDMTVTVDEVMASLSTNDLTLIDARAQPRFRGEVEPIDPVAGHIPGAVCLPCNENVDAQGHFLKSAVLAERIGPVGQESDRVCYCGSGVTACHNILAAAVAGLPLPRLYAGSWSEWITEPDRPIATGD